MARPRNLGRSGFDAEGRHRGEGQAHAQTHGHGDEVELERPTGEAVTDQRGGKAQETNGDQVAAVVDPITQRAEGQPGEGVDNPLDSKDQTDLRVGQTLGVGMQGEKVMKQAEPETAADRWPARSPVRAD